MPPFRIVEAGYSEAGILRGTPYFDRLHFLIRTFGFGPPGCLICLLLLLVWWRLFGMFTA